MTSKDAPLLSLNEVRFGWKAGDPDLIRLDHFTLAAGEKVFVSGPSGCGKSTLLSLIGGVAQPRSGSVEVLGENITTMSTAQRDRFRADHLGIIFQLFNLVPYLTILENVLLPCRFSPRRRRFAIANSHSLEQEAGRLLEHLELDLAELGRRPVVELSIGQQQRVAVARALIGSPDLIIADEPTSALDEGSSERFIELLIEQSDVNGSGIIFVSHDQRVAELFERQIPFESLQATVKT
ncbi:MAG: ABC transporter ATP-binding protein [Burkholderiaceae bacterium]